MADPYAITGALRAERRRRGVSTQVLARVLHVVPHTLTQWEDAKVRLPALPDLMSWAGVLDWWIAIRTPADVVLLDDPGHVMRLLEAERERAGKSQREYATLAGLSTHVISRREHSGDPPALPQLCMWLAVPGWELTLARPVSAPVSAPALARTS